ncbi:AAA family ATPase [bacterium]|nr:AAA family ATPase [bacterium]
MVANQLTNRARTVILGFPKNRKRVSIIRVLTSIKDAGGMGGHLLHQVSRVSPAKTKTIDIQKMVKEAYYQALKFDHSYVGTEHLLLALLKLGRSPDLHRFRLELIKYNIFPSGVGLTSLEKKGAPISSFARSLSQLALHRLSETIVERKECDAVISALLLKNGSNILIVGDKGVGKDTLVHLLARKVVSLEVPPVLLGTQVIEFDILGFMSILMNKGNLEFSMQAFVDELKSMGRVVLYIKNFQQLFFSSTLGLTAPVFYSTFKSKLESAGIPMVAAMSTSLFDKISTENSHIIDNFSIVEMFEPDEEETLKILLASSIELENHHNIRVPDSVVGYAYTLAKDWETDICFPQRGIDLLDSACTIMIQKRTKAPRAYKNKVEASIDLLSSLDSNVADNKYKDALKVRKKLQKLEEVLFEHEKKMFSTRTLTLTENAVTKAFNALKRELDSGGGERMRTSQLSHLAKRIKRKVIGQDEAVETVVKSLIRAKLGLRSGNRPLGNFLFLGPTGVGKTELAKVLASEFFGDKSLIRLDMSDFSEKHTVARLVGAPPGYVGYGEGGELTVKIENNPHSVVLFDEIEKAHADVLNILLQITEEGELVDAKGTTFDFSKAVIILTSNLGTDILHKNGIGFSDSDLSDKKITGRLRHNLKKILRPELLNRFDEAVIFKSLKRKDQIGVLNLLLKESLKALRLQDVELKVPQGVKSYLLKQGYTPEYGARSLRRIMERELLDVVAGVLLKNSERPLNLVVSINNGKVEVHAKA